jgi:ABC-type sulfate transport system permease component
MAVDRPKLLGVPAALPPAVASLTLTNVRSRAMPDDSFIWAGTATGTDRLTVAVVSASGTNRPG